MPNKAIPFSLLEGSRQAKKNRHGDKKDQVKIPAKMPEIPRVGRKMILGPTGRKEWHRVCEILKNSGVLTEVDSTVLAQYCALFEQFAESPRAFLAAQHTQLRLCAIELGLTPSARVKLRSKD